jgi:Na+-driven multidrug efflux pump
LLVPQLAQFFQGQRITRPAMYTSCLAMLLNLALGFALVLGQPFPRIFHAFGFRACPLVTSFAEYVQLAVLWGVFCNIKKLHQVRKHFEQCIHVHRPMFLY